MLAAISVNGWIAVGTLTGAFVMLIGGLIGFMSWSNKHLARPLRAVTGSPASPGVEAVPSMLDRVNDVKTAVDANTDLTRQTHDAVTQLTNDHDALEKRVTSVETSLAETKGRIDGHLSAHTGG